MYNDIIELLTIEDTVDSFGDRQEAVAKKTVFADVRSVGMKEKYEALGVGLKPELVFVLADYYDYDGQEFIDYESVKYKVLRTYRKRSNELEIVVTRSE